MGPVLRWARRGFQQVFPPAGLVPPLGTGANAAVRLLSSAGAALPVGPPALPLGVLRGGGGGEWGWQPLRRVLRALCAEPVPLPGRVGSPRAGWAPGGGVSPHRWLWGPRGALQEWVRSAVLAVFPLSPEAGSRAASLRGWE